MGRKIPAKKHRGVKDPTKQQAQRLQKLKTKINAPPTDPDEQPVPRSLTRLFQFQNKHLGADGKVPKKRIQLNNTEVSGGGSGNSVRGERGERGERGVRGLRRLPGESARAFSLRINSAIKTLSQHHGQEDYMMDVEEEDTKGMRMEMERERRRRKRNKREKEARRAGAGGEGDAPGGEDVPGGGKAHRLTLKKAAKKAKIAERESERLEVVVERVSFGEVAHAPPALPPPRRAAQRTQAARPGRRDLLLSRLLQPAAAAGGAAGVAAGAAAGGAASGAASGAAAGGKPPLSEAERARRERARLDAVAAYRDLKKQRLLLASKGRSKT